MTLTLRVLDAARHRLWLVTGADKAAALRKLWVGDASVPAGRVVRESAFVFSDSAEQPNCLRILFSPLT